MERFNLTKYFNFNKADSDDTWESWILNDQGLKQIQKVVEVVEDYANNRIREQANAYGYPHDVNLWIKEWSWEWGETVEDLIVPTELNSNKVTFAELDGNSDSPTINFNWVTFICEDQSYDFGRWFNNKHEIPVVDCFYKPFGRFDKRMDSVIYSMEMGDYSK